MFDRTRWQREYRMKYPDRRRDTDRRKYLKAEYGLTLEEYDQLLQDAGHACMICGDHIEGKRAHIDHDHTTGRIRGVLCQPCNMALGLFKDSPERLLAAVEYLRQEG